MGNCNVLVNLPKGTNPKSIGSPKQQQSTTQNKTKHFLGPNPAGGLG
jgi:hypothetical protein